MDIAAKSYVSYGYRATVHTRGVLNQHISYDMRIPMFLILIYPW